MIIHFERVSFARNLAYAKFRKNKTLAKISEFTVYVDGKIRGKEVKS